MRCSGRRKRAGRVRAVCGVRSPARCARFSTIQSPERIRRPTSFRQVSALSSRGGLALIGLGISISLDELAMGFTIGLLQLSIVLAVVLIGAQAFGSPSWVCASARSSAKWHANGRRSSPGRRSSESGSDPRREASRIAQLDGGVSSTKDVNGTRHCPSSWSTCSVVCDAETGLARSTRAAGLRRSPGPSSS